MSEEISTPPMPKRSVRADVIERTTIAWDARVSGASWEDAARVAGYTDAANCCRAVRETYGVLPKIERDDLRHLWRERIEVIWRRVLRDMDEHVPGATTAAVRVADRAAQLDGLDEPGRFSLTPSDGELQAWVQLALQATGRASFAEEDDIFDVVDGDVIEDD